MYAFQDANGIEVCVELQSSPNSDIYEASKKLLQDFFPEEDDEFNDEMS